MQIIFVFLLIIAAFIAIIPLSKRTIVYKKTIASLIIAFLFSWALYTFIGLYQENAAYTAQVKIIALNVKNELSEGTEIVFRGAMIDGKWYHATQLCKNYSWLSQDGMTLLWQNYDQPENMQDNLSFQLPEGKDRKLVFDSDKWQGKVKVIMNGDEMIYDCFASSERTKDIAFDLPDVDVTYVPNISLNMSIFCLTFIILFAIFIKLTLREKSIDINLKPREIWGDILRIICIFTVVLLHCTCDEAYLSYAPNAPQWFSRLYLNSLTTLAVPCFFMVSGAFLLRKKQTIKMIWTERIPKLYIPLLFWSVGYILVDIYIWKDGRAFLISLFKSLFIEQYWHLWFIYSIAGLYILLPVVSAIYRLLENNLKFYLLFIILFIPGILHDILIIMGRNIFIPGFSLFYPALGLFILGQYIWERQEFLPKQHWFYGALFFIGLAMTVLGTYYISLRAGTPEKDLFSNGSVGVVLMAVSLFAWAIKMESNWKKWNQKLKQRIGYIGRLTMGIYFIHMFVVLFMGNHINNNILGFSSNSGSMVNMFFGAVVYFFVSLMICWCGSQIPVVRKLFM